MVFDGVGWKLSFFSSCFVTLRLIFLLFNEIAKKGITKNPLKKEVIITLLPLLKVSLTIIGVNPKINAEIMANIIPLAFLTIYNTPFLRIYYLHNKARFQNIPRRK